MTENDTEPDIPLDFDLDFDSASRVLRRANAFALVNIAALVDVSGLREGDAEDDYFVEVPSPRLPELGDRLAHLTYVALTRFDVGLHVMRIAVSG